MDSDPLDVVEVPKANGTETSAASSSSSHWVQLAVCPARGVPNETTARWWGMFRATQVFDIYEDHCGWEVSCANPMHREKVKEKWIYCRKNMNFNTAIKEGFKGKSKSKELVERMLKYWCLQCDNAEDRVAHRDMPFPTCIPSSDDLDAEAATKVPQLQAFFDSIVF